MKEVLLKVEEDELVEPRWVGKWPNAFYEFYVDGTFRKSTFGDDEVHQWAIVNNYVMFRRPDITSPTGYQCYYLCGDNNILEWLAKNLSDAVMEREFKF